MKDFILLLKNPREIFCKDRENTSVFVVFLLYLLGNVASFAFSMDGVNNGAIGSILKQFHLNGYVFLPFIIFFVWLSAIILVSILTPIIRGIACKLDSITIDNKKNFKKLIYLCYLLPNVLAVFVDSIYTVITKNGVKPPYVEPCSTLYTSLIFSIMLSYILDHIYHGKRSANIIPAAYFLITVASTIIGLVS